MQNTPKWELCYVQGSNLYILPHFIKLKSRNSGAQDFMKHVSETCKDQYFWNNQNDSSGIIKV